MSGVASGLYTHGPGIKRQCQNEPDGLSCPSDRRADDLKTLLDPRRSNHNSAIIQCATQPAVPALPVLSNILQPHSNPLLKVKLCILEITLGLQLCHEGVIVGCEACRIELKSNIPPPEALLLKFVRSLVI